MLKKTLSMLVFLSLVSFVFAQSENQETGSEITQPIQAQEHSGYYDYINDIEFRFCNKGEEQSLWTPRDLVTIDGGENKQLCLVFFNRGDKPLKIYYGYGSADIAPNNGLPMCNNINQGDFSKMIAISGESILDIPVGTSLIKYDRLFLPPGIASGIWHGCINYGLQIDTARDPNTMFAVQSRKAAGLDILVNGVASLKNSVSLGMQTGSIFITNKKIKAVTNSDGTVTLSMSVINEGNIDQNISMTGEISNFLGYQEDIVIDPQTLGAYQTLELTNILKNIPSYKGLFNIEMNIHNTPSFNVDVSTLPKNLLQGSDINETGKLFIFSWWWVGIAIVVLFILVRFIRGFFTKKQNKPTNIVPPTIVVPPST